MKLSRGANERGSFGLEQCVLTLLQLSSLTDDVIFRIMEKFKKAAQLNFFKHLKTRVQHSSTLSGC